MVAIIETVTALKITETKQNNILLLDYLYSSIKNIIQQKKVTF